MPDRFPYAPPDRRVAPLLRLLVRPSDAVVLTDDDTVRATFGPFTLETPLANVAGAEVTGPHRWWKAVGVRLSLADSGLTFGTAGGEAVCLRFHEPVGPVIGFRRHDGLTVTVSDPVDLAAAVERRRP